MMSQGLQRALYSLAMSAAIILPLSTVLGGLVCRATAAFDLRENLWRGKPLATLFVVPAAILLGLGSFSVMLARGPGAGCF